MLQLYLLQPVLRLLLLLGLWQLLQLYFRLPGRSRSNQRPFRGHQWQWHVHRRRRLVKLAANDLRLLNAVKHGTRI